MTTRIDDNQFALQVADFFRQKGHPFYAVEVLPNRQFPLVVVWDDNAQVERVIACTVCPWLAADAAAYASAMAAIKEASGEAVCGAVGVGVTPNGWRYHG